MGAFHQFQCSVCGHEFVTSGPWEFYRDARGERRPVGHPRPTSPEAASAGIHGLDAVCYCTRCGNTARVVVREYDKPLDPYWQWEPGNEREKIGHRDIAPPCPHCHGTDLVLDPGEGLVLTCPKCQAGVMMCFAGPVA